MRVQGLNHTLTCFLNSSLSLLWEHANLVPSGTSLFKARTEAPRCTFHIRQSPAYVCRPLRYRILIAVSTLDRLQYAWADVITLRTPVWAFQSPDNSSRPTAAVIRVPRSEISWLYWSAMSLRGGLMGAWGSLIKPTLRVTHGAEAAAPGHRYEHLFFFCPPLVVLPGCLRVTWNDEPVSGWCQHIMHCSDTPLILWFRHCSVPKVPLAFSFSSQAFHKNLDTQSVKPCPAPRAAKTAGKGKCTGLCINFFKSNSHFWIIVGKAAVKLERGSRGKWTSHISALRAAVLSSHGDSLNATEQPACTLPRWDCWNVSHRSLRHQSTQDINLTVLKSTQSGVK